MPTSSEASGNTVLSKSTRRPASNESSLPRSQTNSSTSSSTATTAFFVIKTNFCGSVNAPVSTTSIFSTEIQGTLSAHSQAVSGWSATSSPSMKKNEPPSCRSPDITQNKTLIISTTPLSILTPLSSLSLPNQTALTKSHSRPINSTISPSGPALIIHLSTKSVVL